jgi:hypothetical protein
VYWRIAVVYKDILLVILIYFTDFISFQLCSISTRQITFQCYHSPHVLRQHNFRLQLPIAERFNKKE